MKLVIQIPCLNEEKYLPITLKELPKTIDGIDNIEILVIDDGSNDNTSKVAKDFGVNKVIRLKHHKGLAKAFIIGLNAAIDMGADIIVNTDADNQYAASDIEKLIKPIMEQKADIVIGTRPINKIKEFSILKKILQKLGSKIVQLFSSTRVEDAPSGFRAFSKTAAMKINVFDKYTYTMETIIQAGAKGLNIECIDINTNPSLRKSRLFNNMFLYILRSIITTLRMFIVYRPFRFFITLGITAFLFGTVIGGKFLYLYSLGEGRGHIQSLILSAILILSGLQIGLFAVLAEVISINRKLLEDIQYRLKLYGLKKKSEDLK